MGYWRLSMSSMRSTSLTWPGICYGFKINISNVVLDAPSLDFSTKDGFIKKSLRYLRKYVKVYLKAQVERTTPLKLGEGLKNILIGLLLAFNSMLRILRHCLLPYPLRILRISLIRPNTFNQSRTHLRTSITDSKTKLSHWTPTTMRDTSLLLKNQQEEFIHQSLNPWPHELPQIISADLSTWHYLTKNGV